MLPPTPDQFKALLQAVEALRDPRVRVLPDGPGGVFGAVPAGSSASPSLLDADALYVDMAEWRDEVVLRVLRIFPPAQLEHLCSGSSVALGEVWRWHLARPPWDPGHPVPFSHYQLPTLEQAVVLQRLPSEAYPQRGEVITVGGCTGPVEWTEHAVSILDPVVGTRSFPIWVVMFELGRLPAGSQR